MMHKDIPAALEPVCEAITKARIALWEIQCDIGYEEQAFAPIANKIDVLGTLVRHIDIELQKACLTIREFYQRKSPQGQALSGEKDELVDLEALLTEDML